MFVTVSLAAFVCILRFATHARRSRIPVITVAWISAIVVVGGMTFAKVGAQAGWPAGLYYGVPALVTWALPPITLHMNRTEIARYLPLVVVMAPAIHVLFSMLLGWHEYLPFIPVPNLFSPSEGA